MNTRWDLIKGLMTAVLDTCERIEALNISPEEKSATFASIRPVSVFEMLYSMQNYPDDVAYRVIRARHALADNKPFSSDLEKALINAARVCAELIGASRVQEPAGKTGAHAPEQQSIEESIVKLSQWYKQVEHQITQAVTDSRTKAKGG